eukprot:TRINITY_DN7919_c0_g1_i1.p1 TRINITY_DN7919_c0_g1~~TRINITY_DN7919_c0_g1_i1.p1  ORF type:complete len:205 (-),score=71.17 TRINITY_DN7919_c0_g1_i1:237-824(-)
MSSCTGLKIAVICSSNMNRSMEAHALLGKKGFNVASYGTGEHIKIPGKSIRDPNVYPFGTSYTQIYDDLVKKDKKMYTESGMLHILDRNRRIKERPEKFQRTEKKYDVILTCEERVYDLVLLDFESREPADQQPVHIINMDIVDNPEDATIGAFLFYELVQMMVHSDDVDDDIDEIIQDFEVKSKRSLLHAVNFY